MATRRAAELSRGLSNALARGGALIFATFTLSHRSSGRLDDLEAEWRSTWNDVSYSFRSVIGGAAYRGGCRSRGDVERLKIQGFVRATEATVNSRNSLHVHTHVVWVLERPVEPEQVRAFKERVADRWRRAAERRGRVVSQAHGVDVQYIDGSTAGDSAEALGSYLVKGPGAVGLGKEIAGGAGKTAGKGSRHPFEILADIHRGRQANPPLDVSKDLFLWRTWESVSSARKALLWSKGLRELLLDDEPELSDEELIAQEEEESAVVVGRVREESWKRLAKDTETRSDLAEVVDDSASAESAAAGAEALLESRGYEFVPILVPVPFISPSAREETRRLVADRRRKRRAERYRARLKKAEESRPVVQPKPVKQPTLFDLL